MLTATCVESYLGNHKSHITCQCVNMLCILSSFFPQTFPLHTFSLYFTHLPRVDWLQTISTVVRHLSVVNCTVSWSVITQALCVPCPSMVQSLQIYEVGSSPCASDSNSRHTAPPINVFDIWHLTRGVHFDQMETLQILYTAQFTCILSRLTDKIIPCFTHHPIHRSPTVSDHTVYQFLLIFLLAVLCQFECKIFIALYCMLCTLQ